MELSKNIFFNTDKLIENTIVKISYTGKFFQEESEEVYIHYGFGLEWNGLSEIKMEKTELGFQAEILLSDEETFNFCFRNNINEWDNNEGSNYIFDIEKNVLDLVVKAEDTSLCTRKKLRKTYLWSKKVRIAVYKIITYLPKIISGNYSRKVKNADTE